MSPDLFNLLQLIRLHLIWYPLMELRDIYKLLYQGLLGAEHMVTLPEVYAQRLRLEFEPLSPDPEQTLLEPVRPDRTLFRLNLRACKAHPLNVDQILPFLISTSHLFIGTKLELKQAWAGFTQSHEQNGIDRFTINEIHQFSQQLDQLDFPLMHHSVVYRHEYKPAYRLIAATFLPQLGLNDAG